MGVVLKFFRSMEIPRSPWRVSLGGMPVTERRVDKQPSVAITIQIEYCYFSGTNSSFFFFSFLYIREAVFHPARILAIHHRPATVVRSRLLIERWAARFGFWREARTVVPLSAGSRAEGAPGQFRWSPRRRRSRNTVPFQYTSTWKHLSGSSLTPRWKPSQANAGAVIRNLFDIDRFLYLSRNNTVER